MLSKKKKYIISLASLVLLAGAITIPLVLTTQCKGNSDTQIETIQGPNVVEYGAEATYYVNIKNHKGEATIECYQSDEIEFYEDVEIITGPQVNVANGKATFKIKNVNSSQSDVAIKIKVTNNGKVSEYKQVVFKSEATAVGYSADGTNWASSGTIQGALQEGLDYYIDYGNHIVTYCDVARALFSSGGAFVTPRKMDYGAVDLVIPSSVVIDGVEFAVELGVGAFSLQGYLSAGGNAAPDYFLSGSVTVSEGITSIPEDSFYGYDVLGYNWVFNTAFANFDPVTEIIFPTTITSAGAGCLTYSTSFLINEDNISYVELSDNSLWALGVVQTLDSSLPIVGASDPVVFKEGAIGVGDNFITHYTNVIEVEGVQLLDTIKYIGAGSFSGMDELDTINFPSSLKSIGDSAFKQCVALEDVELNEGLAKIGIFAFQETNIDEIVIPNTVTELGYGAFMQCYNLTVATIGSNITEIPYILFHSCSSLATIHLNSDITKIGEDAFYDTLLLTNFNATTGIAWLDCMNYSWVLKGNPEYESGPAINYGTKTVKGFYNGAFYDCNSWLTQIEIPSTVTEIPKDCFNGANVTSVSLPDSITYITKNGFNSFSWNVLVNNGVTLYEEGYYLKSGDRYFLMGRTYSATSTTLILHDDTYGLVDAHGANQGGMTGVKFNDSLHYIARSSFSDFLQITSISIPASVVDIEEDVFSECRDLVDVDLSNCEALIHQNAFFRLNSDVHLYLSSEIKFSYETSLQNPAFLSIFAVTGTVVSPNGQSDQQFQYFVNHLNLVAGNPEAWSWISGTYPNS